MMLSSDGRGRVNEWRAWTAGNLCLSCTPHTPSLSRSRTFHGLSGAICRRSARRDPLAPRSASLPLLMLRARQQERLQRGLRPDEGLLLQAASLHCRTRRRRLECVSHPSHISCVASRGLLESSRGFGSNAVL